MTLAVLFWSGNFVLGRGIRNVIPPVSLNFWRWLGAFIILIPFGLPRIKDQETLILRHWKYLFLMSIPSIAIFNAFIYTALQSSTTTNTVLVNALVPVFIALAAWLIFGEHLRVRQITGVLISLIGLVFIVSQGQLSILRTLAFSGGDLWTVGAGIAWALYSVMLRRRPAEMDPIAFLTVIVAFGLVALLPFYLWEVAVKGGFALSAGSVAALVYVCLFPSVLSFIFWNSGVALVGANRAGIFFHLMPVFSILLAVLLLDERLQLFHVSGIILIFTGIALTTLKRRRT